MRAADMTEIERMWVRRSAGELAGVYDRPAPQQPDPVQRTRLGGRQGLGAQFAGMDPGRARVISNGRSTIIVPPVPAGRN